MLKEKNLRNLIEVWIVCISVLTNVKTVILALWLSPMLTANLTNNVTNIGIITAWYIYFFTYKTLPSLPT